MSVTAVITSARPGISRERLAEFLCVRALLAFPLALVSSAVSAQSEPIPATVSSGIYHCHPANRTTEFIAGFMIRDDGTYRHDDGSEGRYAYDAKQALITFEAGTLNQQAGLVALSSKLGIVRLYDDRRSEIVRVCDTVR